MSVLGKRLRDAREKSGYKQIDAAKKLGISNGTLSGYERNYRDPDTEILHKMASLYGVSANWLLGMEENRHKEDQIHIDDLEEFLRDKRVKWGDEILTEEEKQRAIEMLRILLKKKNSTD